MRALVTVARLEGVDASGRGFSWRAGAAGLALGVVAGWNLANIGAIADRLAADYEVPLATVGLFTTALFVTHFAVQIPAGKAIDRFGRRRVGLAAAAIVVGANLLPLLDRNVALALAARVAIGLGSGTAFVAGSDYIRAATASPVGQGVYGGVSVSSGGVALAVVPLVAAALDWRAPSPPRRRRRGSPARCFSSRPTAAESTTGRTWPRASCAIGGSTASRRCTRRRSG